MLTIPGISPRRKLGVYNDLGVGCELAGRFKEAKEAYLESLKIHQELGLPTGSVIGNLASLAFSEKKLDEALRYGLQAQQELEASGPLEHLFNNSELLSNICSAKGDFKKALAFSKLAYLYNDSLNTLERQSEYLDLEKKYQTELKNKTIAEQKNKLAREQQEKNVLWGGILGLAVISVLGGSLFYLNRKRKESRLETEIAESEMKALRAQMNPHFMFNSLNAIQQMVMNQENDNAYQYLDAYARLTRQILENSEKKWITVREELRFLELYLQIESLRFGHAFRYQLEASDEVMPNSDKLPAMVVQPVVENALKHGLLPKQGEKRLRIFFDRKDEGPLEVVVEDNGVGRAASGAVPKETDHHSMSLGITENRLRLLDRQGGSKMAVEDLKQEDGSPAGTRVRILISQNA
jgi:two-component system, LytTR family, sensor kinase